MTILSMFVKIAKIMVAAIALALLILFLFSAGLFFEFIPDYVLNERNKK